MATTQWREAALLQYSNQTRARCGVVPILTQRSRRSRNDASHLFLLPGRLHRGSCLLSMWIHLLLFVSDAYNDLNNIHCWRHCCRAECQLDDWNTHSDKGCKLQQQLTNLHSRRRTPDPQEGKCTGCGVHFTANYCEVMKCPDCEYRACEACICHDFRGEYDEGLRRI